MIDFEEVELIGYCNIPYLVYRLNRPGITILRGDNGKGKTQIFSSIPWCLFGKTLKKSNSPEPWEDIRTKEYKGTKVSVSFTKEGSRYQVIRCKNYKLDVFGYPGKNRLVLVKDGKPMDSLRDNGDVQDYVIKLLGYSFLVFKNSIIFGQKLTKMIGETGPRKKEILEEAFQVTFIADAKERAKKKLNPLCEELNTCNSEYLVLENKKKNLEDTLITLSSDSDSWVSLRSKNILQLKKELREASVSIDRANANIKGIQDYNPNRLEELNRRIGELSSSTTTLEKYKSQLKETKARLEEVKEHIDSHKEGKCSYCGSVIKPGTKPSKKTLVEYDRVKGLIGELEKSIKLLSNNPATIKALKDEVREISMTKSRIETLKSTITINQSIIKRLKSDLVKAKDKVANPNPYIIRIEETEKSLERVKKEFVAQENKLKKLKKHVEAYKWVIDEPLSNKGIKAYIFEHNVKKINLEAQKYNRILGFGVKFYIDLESKTKDIKALILQGNRERDYDDLSGGQQQLVDVCAAFAMHDVKSRNSNTNILLMDEIFESLDSKNVEKVADLIKVKAKESCVHIITHRKDFSITNCTVLLLKSTISGLKLIDKS